MAELRLVSTSATDRLAARIAAHNGLTPEEGRYEAEACVRFFSALLGLPAPCHGPTPQALLDVDAVRQKTA